MNKLKKNLGVNFDPEKIEKVAKDLTTKGNQRHVRISISLNFDIHKKLKTFCTYNDTNIQNVVSTLIDVFLENNKDLEI